MNRTKQAIALVDSGATPSAAAKLVGITRQAVDAALRHRAQIKPERTCDVCGTVLPASARKDAMTCSVRCRVARVRRIKAEAEQAEQVETEQKRQRIAAEIDRIKAKAAAKG